MRHPTLFEERVYAVVRTIPRGQTRSYRWVAARLGNPGLARAVGNALNRNPYAPAAPGRRLRRRPERSQKDAVSCHRVVRSDGSLGGFAQGPRRKRALLRREGVVQFGG